MRSRTLYCVLGFLTWQPMSGYDIKKAIEQSTAHFWSESYGQIYPILRELAEAGLIEPESESRGDGRERQVWRITRAGRTELQRWLAEPCVPGSVRNEMLLKLFFGRHAPDAANRAHIEGLRAHNAAALKHCRGVCKQLAELDGMPDARYWHIAARLGEIQAAAVLKWCDEALALFPATDKRAAQRRGGRASSPRTKRRSKR